MATPSSAPNFSSIYARPAGDDPTLRNRQLLAGALQKARSEGKSIDDALKEIGVDRTKIDDETPISGVELKQSEIAGYAERLFGGSEDKAAPNTFASQERAAQERAKKEGAFGGPVPATSSTMKAGTPRLDRLAALQGLPLGSTSPLRRNETSPTGGTPLGRGRKGGGRVTLTDIFRPQYEEFEREERLRKAEEDAFINRPTGGLGTPVGRADLFGLEPAIYKPKAPYTVRRP
jgi:hypothetical protein